MPEVSRFFGILIRMYFDDHQPPHFHAIYAGSEAEGFLRGGFRTVRCPWFWNGQRCINGS